MAPPPNPRNEILKPPELVDVLVLPNLAVLPFGLGQCNSRISYNTGVDFFIFNLEMYNLGPCIVNLCFFRFALRIIF